MNKTTFNILRYLSIGLVFFVLFMSSVEAAQVYVKLPLGTRAVVMLLDDNGQEALRGETDQAGQFYSPQGVTAGDYVLRVEDLRGQNVHEIAVTVEDKDRGLACVLRPKLPWIASENTSEEESTVITPKVFLIMLMMFCCLVVMVLILHKKAMLRPLVGKLAFWKSINRQLPSPSRTPFAARSVALSASSSKIIEETLDIKQFKTMENNLAKQRSAYTLRGKKLAQASDWNRDLGDLVLVGQRYAGGVGGVYEGYGTRDKNRRLAIKMPLSRTILKPNNRHDLDSIKAEFDNNHDMGGTMRLLQFYELRQLVVHNNGKQVPVYLSVMEYVDGLSLRNLINMGRDLDVRQRRLVMREVLEAMLEAHSKNKIHNDIKPDNVLVNFDRSSMTVTGVKLIDFGAQVEVRQDDPARARKLTPDYCAPEVLGGGFPSVESDIYSAGLMFYELFENMLPFPSGQGDVFNATPKEFDLAFSKLTNESALQIILKNMLIKSVPDRVYASVSDILSNLRHN